MAEQQLSTGLTGQLSQHQTLSQNLLRSLELLALPIADLDARIAAEINNNPMLEVEEFPRAEKLSADTRQEETDDENDYEKNSVLADEWSDSLPLPSDNGDSGERSDYIGSLPAPPPQLRSLLIDELFAASLEDKQLRAALEIVGALDDDGYLPVPLADLAMLCDADLPEMEEALHIVQQLAPPGTAARDLPECLKLQLIRSGQLTDKLEELLDNGMEHLANQRHDLLIKELDITPECLENMLKTLRRLNPAPGRQERGSAIITPDMEILRNSDGSFTVEVKQNYFKSAGISKYYEKLLDDNSISAEDRAFIQEKIAKAKELLRALEMRKNTLHQLGELLIERQSDFLENGVESLKSMTMKSAAEALNISESTVSRAAAEKFIKTPQGTFPLKFFFPSGYDSAENSGISNQAVMEKIRRMIQNEDPAAPLSDDAISQTLKEQDIHVARRTVAKYRDALRIPPSSIRKKRLN